MACLAPAFLVREDTAEYRCRAPFPIERVESVLGYAGS